MNEHPTIKTIADHRQSLEQEAAKAKLWGNRTMSRRLSNVASLLAEAEVALGRVVLCPMWSKWAEPTPNPCEARTFPERYRAHREAAFVEMIEAIISFFEDNSKSARRRNAILTEARALLAKVQA